MRRLTRTSGIVIWLGWACLGPGVEVSVGQVQGRIRRVGLFEGASPLIRSGNWSFVEVELRCLSSTPFDGELRAEQFDRDGDVAKSIQKVALAPNEQWRPYEVYFVPNLISGSDQIHVRLYDAKGILIKIKTDAGEEVSDLVSSYFTNLSPDEYLIVDLTVPGKLPHVAWLSTPPEGKNVGVLINNRTIRSLSPQELPSHWQGLEAVDAIVWDDADPSLLSRQQSDALVAWVRGGGRLLITASRNWQSLANSPLSSVFPASIRGIGQQREALEFTDDIVQDFEYGGRLARQYLRHPIQRCDMKIRPQGVGIPSRCANPQIAYRRLLGRGSLTLVGASLRELLPAPDSLINLESESASKKPNPAEVKAFVRICNQVVAENFLGLPAIRNENAAVGMFNPVNLFDLVRRTIGFQTVGAAFLIFAILFAITYTLLATVGSYWYLRRRGWQHHCWTSFAIVSGVGIVIGTGMVWLLRGTSTRLWQTTVIDARAGSRDAFATCLIGIKTPNHMRLDLRLTRRDTKQTPLGYSDVQTFDLIRGMPSSSSPEEIETTYVAPEIYRSSMAGHRMRDVPIRATLKEFQGSWHGPLGGIIEGKFVMDRQGRFGTGSFLRNRLDCNLHNCYILEDAKQIATAGRVITTRCLYLGDFPKSGEGSTFDDQALRKRLYYKSSSEQTTGEEPKLISNRKLLLTESIKGWKASLSSLSQLTGRGTSSTRMPNLLSNQEYASMLLLSVFDLLEPDPNGKLGFLRSYGRRLGCAHQLTRETAILIGYSDEPAPVTVEVGEKPLLPEKSRTMYRFVIPIIRPS